MEIGVVLRGASAFLVKGIAVAGSFYAGRFLARTWEPQWRNYLAVLVLAALAGLLAGAMLESRTGELGPVRFKVSPVREERVEYGAVIFLALGIPAALGVFVGNPDRGF